jgi:hypothetical protein
LVTSEVLEAQSVVVSKVVTFLYRTRSSPLAPVWFGPPGPSRLSEKAAVLLSPSLTSTILTREFWKNRPLPMAASPSTLLPTQAA